MSNETCKLIFERVSQRSYDIDKPIPENIVKEILEACRQAPSARFLQSLDFYYVDDPKRIEQLGAPFKPILLEKNPVSKSRLEEGGVTDPLYYNAGLVIFFCARSEEAMKENSLIQIDVGIAAENAVIAAQSHGLRSVHVGLIRKFDELTHESFGIPKSKPILHSLAIGYPKHSDPPHKKRRDDCFFKL